MLFRCCILAIAPAPFEGLAAAAFSSRHQLGSPFGHRLYRSKFCSRVRNQSGIHILRLRRLWRWTNCLVTCAPELLPLSPPLLYSAARTKRRTDCAHLRSGIRALRSCLMVTHTVPMSNLDAERAPSLRNSSVSRKSLVGRVNADFMTQKKVSGSFFFTNRSPGVQKLAPRDLYVIAEVGLFGFLFAGTRCFGLRRRCGLRRGFLFGRSLMLLRCGLALRGCSFGRAFCARRSRLTCWLCSRSRLLGYRLNFRARRL